MILPSTNKIFLKGIYEVNTKCPQYHWDLFQQSWAYVRLRPWTNWESSVLCIVPCHHFLYHAVSQLTPPPKLIYNIDLCELNTPLSFPITLCISTEDTFETGTMNNFSDLRSSRPKQSSYITSLPANQYFYALLRHIHHDYLWIGTTKTLQRSGKATDSHRMNYEIETRACEKKAYKNVGLLSLKKKQWKLLSEFLSARKDL